MATSKSNTRIHHVRADEELLIDIYPRARVTWQGTSEQLEREGLIPNGFDWPKGRDNTSWADETFEYRVHRCRRPGMKGPMRLWVEGDYWTLWRTLKGASGQGLHDALVYEKRQELEKLLQERSFVQSEQWRQFCEAVRDTRFQDILNAIGCKPPFQRFYP